MLLLENLFNQRNDDLNIRVLPIVAAAQLATPAEDRAEGCHSLTHAHPPRPHPQLRR